MAREQMTVAAHGQMVAAAASSWPNLLPWRLCSYRTLPAVLLPPHSVPFLPLMLLPFELLSAPLSSPRQEHHLDPGEQRQQKCTSGTMIWLATQPHTHTASTLRPMTSRVSVRVPTPPSPRRGKRCVPAKNAGGGGKGWSLALGTHNGNYGGRYAQVTCLPSSRVYQVQTTAIYFYLLVEAWVRDSAGVGRSVS